MSGPQRAYVVYDGDEQTVVIFATNGAAARRQGANEMVVDFEEVASCKRALLWTSTPKRATSP